MELKKKFTPEELVGKWIVGFDTLCEGNQCMTTDDEEGDSMPALLDSREEAITEMFDGNLEMLKNKSDEDLSELEISRELVSEMETIYDSKDAKAMEDFLDQHPECNYNDEFVQEASEFILGRKAFFTGGAEGGYITGEKLS